MLKTLKLKVNELKIDHSYQRDLDERRTQAMADSFDEDRLGALAVSRRQDGFYVLDGQHRVDACKKANFNGYVLCRVHEHLSPQDEAALFLTYQEGRVAVHALDKYRARLAAREQIALEINTIVRQLGLTISACPGTKSVCAISAVEWVHTHRKNLGVVLAVLKPWAAAFDSGAFDGKLIRAVSVFLSQHPNADPDELTCRIIKREPRSVIAEIKAHQRDFAQPLAIGFVLRSIYNKGNKNRLLPPEV